MRGVGRQHHRAARGLDPHHLQAVGMAADAMHGHAGRNLAVAGMEGDALAIDMAHHQRDVLDRERMPHQAVAHAAPRRVAHLAILQMEARIGKAIEIAGVVVMQMGDDDVADRIGLDAKACQRIDRIERQLAGARLGLFGVEAGIDQDVAAAAADQPDEVIEVLRRGVVRIGYAGNSCGGCAATSSHSAARRFRRRFPSVSLFFCVSDWPMSAPSHCHPQRSNPRGRLGGCDDEGRALCETRSHYRSRRLARRNPPAVMQAVPTRTRFIPSAPIAHASRSIVAINDDFASG